VKPTPKTKSKQVLSASDAGLELDPHQIVLRPLITEKGTHLVERHNTYLFQVHPKATKGDVKRAVEALFDVSVVDVRTIRRKGKPRRYRNHASRRPDTKRALVELSENDRIALF
jgi:large subunit ribosomal protein L23